MSARLWLALAGAAGWVTFIGVTIRYLVVTLERRAEQPFFIHFDWHAYLAGAHALLDRGLYREPLELGGTPLPLESFNMPPLAAAEAALLIPLGQTPGGLVWQVIGAAGVGFAAVALARLAGARWGAALLAGGAMLGGYMLVDHIALPDEASYWWGLSLGTNNYLVLGLVAAVAVAYRAGHTRLAGIGLGLAVATKLWPVTLLVLLLRERSWQVIAWTAGTLVVQGVVWLAWLGPDAVGPGIRALGSEEPDPGLIIGPAALRELASWWPSWIGWAVGAALLAIPARGHLGMGLGILAGLAVITNLWGHYLPTVLFGGGLLAIGLSEWWRARRAAVSEPAPA
jgi:hypothetical protein